MELTNMVREGDLDALETWFEQNSEPTKDEIMSGGVSIAHWAASADNTEVCQCMDSFNCIVMVTSSLVKVVLRNSR
jgi:hypothetical protein